MGVLTAEGAYYDYDRDDAAADSDGFFALLSFLFPQQVGIGQLQPMVRYQSLDIDSVSETDQIDLGLNYIIDGHNARISLVYADMSTDFDAGGSLDTNMIKIGLQIQQ